MAQQFDELIRQAYGGIGRSGFGGLASQIDQPGYDYWMSQLQSGAIAPENFQGVFGSAVQQAIAEDPQSQYAQYIQSQAPVAQPTAPDYSDLVTKAYQGIGRTGFGAETTQIDQPGYDYWLGQLQSGAIAPEAFQGIFSNAVNQYTAANQTDPLSQQIFGIQAPAQFVGEAGTPDFNTLNKGFEWAQANKLEEDALKKALGEEVYNDYTKQYGQGILEAIQPALEDGKLDAKEALSVVNEAKKFGLDADEIAKYTALNPDLTNAFFDTYDKVVSGIVTSAFDKESETSELDRVKSLLALQNQYGVTDEDIAKYSDGSLSKTDVQEYLNPIRNFGDDFKNAVQGPDTTAKDALSFIDKAQDNPILADLYGEKLAEVEEKIGALAPKWESYGVDPLQAETLYSQINKITEAAGGKNWNGSWMSGGDNAAMHAAAMLQKRGVDNLADLKVVPQYEQAPAVEISPGKYARMVTTRTGGDSESEYTEYVPLTAEEAKTYDPETQTFTASTGAKLIDASTGKVIGTDTSGSNRFTIDSYDTGNIFKGKSKSFGIQFSNDGVPIPFTTTEKEGLVYSPILPILASFLIPGLASTISGALPGAAVTGGAGAAGAAAGIGYIPATALNTALSSSLAGGAISGGMAALQGANPLKAFLGGAAGPLMNYGISSLLPAGVNPAVAKTVGSVASTALRGGDIKNALLSGITNTAMNTALNTAIDPVLKGLDITPAQLNLATGIVAPLLMGKDINPAAVMKTIASAGSARR